MRKYELIVKCDFCQLPDLPGTRQVRQYDLWVRKEASMPPEPKTGTVDSTTGNSAHVKTLDMCEDCCGKLVRGEPPSAKPKVWKKGTAT